MKKDTPAYVAMALLFVVLGVAELYNHYYFLGSTTFCLVVYVVLSILESRKEKSQPTTPNDEQIAQP